MSKFTYVTMKETSFQTLRGIGHQVSRVHNCERAYICIFISALVLLREFTTSKSHFNP